PASNRIELRSGQTYTGEMSVQNTTDADMTIKTSVGSYSIIDNNYNSPNYDSPSKWSVIKDWIKIDKTDFVLAPGESQIIKYTVTTPADPPAGMQYATIFAENVPPKTDSGITATSRIGMVLSARMLDGETIEKASIQNDKIAGYQPTSPLKASFSVKNEGNIGADVTYSLKVKNAFNGSEVYSSESQTSSVYPETTRNMSLKWDQVGIGFYNVEMIINLNGREHTVKKLVCTVPVWIIILLAIAILSLIAYAVINHRMRQETRGGSKTTKKATTKKK
ncbi:MAG: hypothetical protein Q4C83_03185, partial [Candidatus Saccharibacteria bacterium]|nr:hypothetical protein [Candidatus Saccharibacteria bacterium]